MAFVSLLLISNVIAQKLINVGSFTLTAGILIFPVSYVFGDALTEVYGYVRTRRIIWMGLFLNLFMAVMTWVTIRMPPAPGWPFQHEFQTALGLVPRIVAASILGYWAGEFSNSYVLARLKLRMNGSMFWVRTISSTIVGGRRRHRDFRQRRIRWRSQFVDLGGHSPCRVDREGRL